MNLLRALNRRLSTDRFAARTAQMLCYGIALLVMVLGIRKVTAMRLDEPQLVFGLLLVMVLTFQVIIMGTVVGLHGRKQSSA
jgi:hypothetical protein